MEKTPEQVAEFEYVAKIIAALRGKIGNRIAASKVAKIRTEAYAMPASERKAFFEAQYEDIFNQPVPFEV